MAYYHAWHYMHYLICVDGWTANDVIVGINDFRIASGRGRGRELPVDCGIANCIGTECDLRYAKISLYRWVREGSRRKGDRSGRSRNPGESAGRTTIADLVLQYLIED